VTITGSDEAGGSGITGAAYSFDGGSTWETANTKVYTGNQTVQIAIRDAVGNVATGSVTFSNIDRGVPTVTITPSSTSPTS
jgi:hypothetical protein